VDEEDEETAERRDADSDPITVPNAPSGLQAETEEIEPAVAPDAEASQADHNSPEAGMSSTQDAQERKDAQDVTNTNIHSHVESYRRYNKPDMSVVSLIESADRSAGRLVNLLAKHFPSFRDEARFDGKRVRFLKRAQILVADLWAAFNGTSYGHFDDIDHLTMFAGKQRPTSLTFRACRWRHLRWN
jgi:hypothetical protein